MHKIKEELSLKEKKKEKKRRRVSKPLETEQTKRRKRTSGVRTIRRLYI
jgi:hypothetical protein